MSALEKLQQMAKLGSAEKSTMEVLLQRLQEKKQSEAIAKILKPLIEVLVSSVRKTEEMLRKNTETKVASALQKLETATRELNTSRSQISNIEGIADKSANRALNDARREIESAVSLIQKKIPQAFDARYLENDIRNITAKLGKFAGISSIEALTSEIEKLRKTLDELNEKYEKQGKIVTKLQGASQTPSPQHWARHESFTMNGVDTSVTLQYGVGASGNAVIARYMGQTLDLGNQYTVDGNKITLDFTPANGTTISVTYWS